MIDQFIINTVIPFISACPEWLVLMITINCLTGLVLGSMAILSCGDEFSHWLYRKTPSDWRRVPFRLVVYPVAIPLFIAFWYAFSTPLVIAGIICAAFKPKVVV